MVDVDRAYELVGPDGSRTPVILRVFDCREIGPSHWGTSFTISGLGYEAPRTVYGVDAVQSTLAAFSVARVILESWPPARGTISFLGQPIGADARIYV